MVRCAAVFVFCDMQSYFGPISADENIALLDQDIARSLDVSGALPRTAITDSSTSQSTLQRLNSAQLFGDEDVFMCGKCKHQFIDLHMFFRHKKDGCNASNNMSGLVHDQQDGCLPTIQLPHPVEFQNSQRPSELHSQSILLPHLSVNSSQTTMNATQPFGQHVDMAGLNLSQNTQKDRTASCNPVRVAAQSSGICSNSTSTAPPSNLSVNMSDMNSFVQLQSPCGLLQGTGVSLGSDSIVISDDILANSSSPSPSVFNTDTQLDRCFQDSEGSEQHLSTLVSVLGGSEVAPLMNMPAQTTFHQSISTLNNPQQVYIHIQPQQQPETQTTYSILPKNPSMNYAVGLNLSSLHVASLPVNADSSTNMCSTQEGYFQPHMISMQDISKQSVLENKEEGVAQTIVEMQAPGTVQKMNPVLAVKRKLVSKKIFTCQYCGKSFSKTFDLNQHVRSHTGEKPFQCVVCGRAFAQRSNVRKHMETHKVWPKEAMEILPIMVVHPRGAAGTDQGETEHGINPLMYPKFPTATKLCPYCNLPLGSYNERKTHMLRHKDKQVYKCLKENCEQTYSDLDDYLEHVKTHQGTMRYRCHHCQKLFDSLKDIGEHQYKEHLNNESNTRQFVKHQCKLCPAKFSRLDVLQKHMAMETHKHVCAVCSKHFSCASYLDHHMKKMHAGTPRKKYKCELCGKFMNSVYYLQSHMLIHTKEKPFKCQICDARFNRKDKLSRHMVTHDPNKKYKCPFRESMNCMKEFNRPDKLKAHIISHNGIKAHQCSYCPKKFSRRNIKVAHEKTHTFQYGCESCGKSFKNQSTLETHKCRIMKQKPPSGIGCDKNTGKVSTALGKDLVTSPEGPMYAIRTGSKRRHLRRNVSRPVKGIGRKTDMMKSNIEINFTADAIVSVKETAINDEGDT